MTNEIDYKELLQKYILHIGRNEGIYYLRPSDFDDSLFLPSEWSDLQALLLHIQNEDA